MSLSRKIITALLLATTLTASAQVSRNAFPYAEGVVYDNNGHDLKAFINSNKQEAQYRGGKINEFSGDQWGYLQVGTVSVPSLDKNGNLNFSEPITATVALHKTKDGSEATWWSRQCSTPKGPLVKDKIDVQDRLALPLVSYDDVMHDLQPKAFTIVEYNNDNYNQYDYDELLKNCLLVKIGTVKNADDYKKIILFYNDFLKKFTYLEDPLLENKSFITFFTANGNKYVGYFNIVNSKLSGHLEAVYIDYEKDEDVLLNSIFGKLTGHVVYVYGDNTFGMDKNLLNYGRAHTDITIINRSPSSTKVFNKG